MLAKEISSRRVKSLPAQSVLLCHSSLSQIHACICWRSWRRSGIEGQESCKASVVRANVIKYLKDQYPNLPDITAQRPTLRLEHSYAVFNLDMDRASPAVQSPVGKGSMDDQHCYERQHEIESDVVKSMVCVQRIDDPIVVKIPVSQVCLQQQTPCAICRIGGCNYWMSKIMACQVAVLQWKQIAFITNQAWRADWHAGGGARKIFSPSPPIQSAFLLSAVWDSLSLELHLRGEHLWETALI